VFDEFDEEGDEGIDNSNPEREAQTVSAAATDSVSVAEVYEIEKEVVDDEIGKYH
jgi:hypothetical protein